MPGTLRGINLASWAPACLLGPGGHHTGWWRAFRGGWSSSPFSINSADGKGRPRSGVPRARRRGMGGGRGQYG